MTVAELCIKALENEGVKQIFGVPSEENEALLLAMRDPSIEFVPVRHEQGGAFIANVYGRLTGKAGVCLSTLCPGATNLLTGVADANLDRAPLVAITGQGGVDRQHYESHQMIDVIQMFRPVTKWNAPILSPDVTTELVSKAFTIAQHEKPGATHLELAEDNAEMTSEISEVIATIPYELPVADRQSISRARNVIKASKRPLMLVGNGAVRTECGGNIKMIGEITSCA
jgi:acetolactate synthase-1/2/3 large subunit